MNYHYKGILITRVGARYTCLIGAALLSTPTLKDCITLLDILLRDDAHAEAV